MGLYFLKVDTLGLVNHRRFHYLWNSAWGGLTFISWRPHEMELYLPTLVRIGLVEPLEQRNVETYAICDT